MSPSPNRKQAQPNRSTSNKSKVDVANSRSVKRSKYTCVSKPVHSSSSDYLDRNIGEKCSSKRNNIMKQDKIKESNRFIMQGNPRDRFIARAKSHIGVFPNQKIEKVYLEKEKLPPEMPASLEKLLNEQKQALSMDKSKILVNEEKKKEEIPKITQTTNKIITIYKDTDLNTNSKIFKEIFHNKDVFNSEEMLDKENLTETLSKLIKMSDKIDPKTISKKQSLLKNGSDSSKSIVPIESDMDTTKCMYSSHSDSMMDISGQVSLTRMNSSKNFGVSSSNFQSNHRDVALSVNKSSIKNLQFKFKPLQEKYEELKKSPVMKLPQIDAIFKGNSNIDDNDYQCWLRKHKFLEDVDSNQKMLTCIKQESTSTSSCNFCCKDDPNLSNCSDLTSISQRNRVIRIQFKTTFEESLLVEQNVLWNGVKYLYDIYSNEELIVEHVSITDKFKRFVIVATFIYFVIYFDNFLSDFDMQMF